METKNKVLSYGFTRLDSGLTYSIDELNIQYLFDSYNPLKVIDDLSSIYSKHLPEFSKKLNVKMDLKPCSRYAWYCNHVWGNGIITSFGIWKRKENKEWHCLPYLKVKFNPNKHFNEPLLDDLMNYIFEHMPEYFGHLQKYDFAMDYPGTFEKVYIDSRKEHGLFKGTVYFGQRGEHGRCKKYNKQEEMHLEKPDTRIEYTFKVGYTRNFDSISFVGSEVAQVYDSLPEVSKRYLDMLLEMKRAKLDYNHFVERLNYRMRKALLPILNGSYSPYIVKESLLDELLDEYGKKYHFEWFDVVQVIYEPNKPICDDELDFKGFEQETFDSIL